MMKQCVIDLKHAYLLSSPAATNAVLEDIL
jgi:hypothetical protein